MQIFLYERAYKQRTHGTWYAQLEWNSSVYISIDRMKNKKKNQKNKKFINKFQHSIA